MTQHTMLALRLIDGSFRQSMFLLLYGRGSYYASSKRVQNLRIKTQMEKKRKQVIEPWL